mgnify:CR=1 FL=1
MGETFCDKLDTLISYSGFYVHRNFRVLRFFVFFQGFSGSGLGFQAGGLEKSGLGINPDIFLLKFG